MIALTLQETLMVYFRRNTSMDIKTINPFIQASSQVLLQMGFKDVKQGNISAKEKDVVSKGIMVVAAITNQVVGTVVYNFTAEVAKKFASTMMGMPVANLDEMTQSALCEVTNMISSNVITLWGKEGLKAATAPPRLVLNGGNVQVDTGKFVVLEMVVDGEIIEINIALNVV
jgi:chemotaxis protein CheX